MTAFDDTAKRRLRFLTRRGLLELDIMLGRFMDKHFQSLNDSELTIFAELLDWQDQEFLAIVNQKENAPSAKFEPLLEKIRSA